MSTASTSMERSEMRWNTIRLVVSIILFCSVEFMQTWKTNAALVPEEENALEALQESFNLPKWTGDPCNNIDVPWITCSNNSESVFTIFLKNRNVTGTISDEITKLRNLTALNLSTNKLQGPIPNISNMTNLEILDLSGNNLTGHIPDMGASKRISQILMSGNNLIGGIPAGLFQHSTLSAKVDLSNNPLGGPIPDLSNLTQLTELYLVKDQLNGTIPVSIQKMTLIKQLNLAFNPQLKGTIPNLTALYKLEYLNASSCALSGSLPEFKNAKELRGLYLDNNNFSGSIPPGLFQLGQLQWLILNNNSRLSGEVPDMSQLSNIENMYLQDCNLSGPLPPSLQNTTKLRFLILTNNRLRTIPSDLRNLTKLEQIFMFELFTRTGSHDLWRVASGPTLGNFPLGSGPSEQIGQCWHSDCNVQNNNMTGRLPELPPSSSQTNVEGYRLKWLLFSNNNFSGEIPKSWSELSLLEGMILDHNSLSGTIPKQFGNLTSLKNLNLRNNRFSGLIPEDLGRLSNLEHLDLSNNQFNGTVPEALASLPNLKELRLDNNRFTEIPEALAYKQGLNISFGNNTNIKIIGTGKNRTSSGLSTGGIVGVSIGALVAGFAILAILLYRNRRNAKYGDFLSREDMPKSAQAFTLKQIKSITGNNKTMIGKGGFGPVFYGRLSDGKEVAVKVRATDSKQGAGEFLNEVRLLSRLHHRNLVPLVGYCLESQQQILVYDYMSQGTLDDHLYNYHKGSGSNTFDSNSDQSSTCQPLSWKMRLKIALNAARGLEYLHKDCNPPVIHRDVKSSNILLGDKLQAKVADLGISKQVPEPDTEELNISGVSTAIKGTFGYLDPEYFVRRKLTTKSDVYSFGMVLLEIITGKRPHSHEFTDSDETNLIDWVRGAVSINQLESTVDPALGGEYDKEGMLRVAMIALSCVLPSAAERPEMGNIVNTLTEALEMEGENIHILGHANEKTVPYSGQLNAPGASSLTSTTETYVSSVVRSHPSWNTDPR